MRRILKALILAWIGKKIYARMRHDEPEDGLAGRSDSGAKPKSRAA